MTRLASILTAVLLFAAAQADAHPPIKINFVFRFDVENTERLQLKNLAPWYTYFPYDPHVHGQAPQFPTWPQPWPGAPKKDAPMSPMTGSPTTMPWQPVAYRPSPNPAHYAAYHQAPSYWYGR